MRYAPYSSRPRSNHRNDEWVALYHLWAKDRTLLYIGISKDPWKRFEQHEKDKWWWTLVDEWRIDWFPNRSIALDAETEAIYRENPAHNISRPQPWPWPQRLVPNTQRGTMAPLSESVEDYCLFCEQQWELYGAKV